MAKRRSRYGRAILGDEEFERQKQIQKETRGVYGPAIAERDRREKGEKAEPKRKPADPAPRKPPERRAPEPSGGTDIPLDADADPTDADLTLKELEELLENEPHRLERQISAEWVRPDGPRKGAIRLFLDLEREREGGARPDLVRFLDNALSAR